MKHYSKLEVIKETIKKEAREGAVEERRGRCYCVQVHSLIKV
jgi:hypothetical protein